MLSNGAAMGPFTPEQMRAGIISGDDDGFETDGKLKARFAGGGNFHIPSGDLAETWGQRSGVSQMGLQV